MTSTEPRRDVLGDLARLARDDDPIDLVAAYRSYAEQRGDDDLDSFLCHLHETQTLPLETVCELHARALPEVDLEAPVEAAQAAPYRLLAQVGEGAAGSVHLARDPSLQRRVALKVLKGDTGRPRVRDRFVGEAQLTAQLEHPNIVPVYGLERTADGVRYAMKMVHGRTFQGLIEQAREAVRHGRARDAGLDLPARLEHLLKVCDAMAYAHAKGVLHRDLKPENLMLGQFGEVLVMDWGIARLIDRASPLDRVEAEEGAVADDAADPTHQTRTAGLCGTPRYMSPEQAAGATDLDPRSDQFALGLILQELVTLRPAVAGATLKEVVVAIVTGRLQPVVHVTRRRLPVELRAIIARATARRRDDRYPSVDALAEDLRRYLRGEAVRAHPDTPWQAALRWLGRHREAALTLMLVMLASAATVVVWSVRRASRLELAALAAARHREARLTALQSAVSSQAHRIDRHFMRNAVLLRGLASQAVHLLERSDAARGPLYEHTDFADPRRAPPDLAPSVRYRKPVSLDWPVVKRAPGTPLAAVRPLLERLVPLRHAFRRTLLQSRSDGAAGLSPTARRALLADAGVPVCWAYLGLAQGVMLSYPGKASYPDDYDPRARPWYRLGRGHHAVRWGNPYADIQGLGLVLPCVTGLFGRDGRVLGVAGLEMTFDEIIRSLMQLPDVAAARETYLLDEQGRVQIRSSEAGRRVRISDPARPLPAFPDPRVVAAVRGGASGTLAREGAAGRLLAVHVPLPTVGWAFVVDVELAQLLR